MNVVTRHAPKGMVASVDHLASEAGVAMLRAGGSAADAAIAANAVLSVTAPHLCGMGGDLFALVHRPGDVAPAALNASGRAGSGADPDRLRREGRTVMPFKGDLRSATVPGCVDGWLALHGRFGRLPLEDVFGPAIGYARDGFPASPLLAAAVQLLHDLPATTELVGSGRRRAGDRVLRPGVAAALDTIASDGRRGFYQGQFGDGLLRLGAGEYQPVDLQRPLADWVEPLSVTVWDHVVWTIPPNSQGYLTLLGAKIAEQLPLPAASSDPDWAHLLIESARIAGHDRLRVLHEDADVGPLLEPASVASRRALIDPEHHARLASPVGGGDTTYLCAVDANRMGVSLIQSNASDFGCRVFEPVTGIGLHNRGIGFSLQPGHPAEYLPNRRPPHTLSPALVTRIDGSLRATLGTMGGDAQPQILLQLLVRLLRDGQSVGAALSAPRWVLTGADASTFQTWADPDGTEVEIEDAGWAAGLRARGHTVRVVDGLSPAFGHAQIIEVADNGGLAGAADPRALIGTATGY